MLGQERWKDVVGWEGYYKVSDRGRIKSLDRTIVDKGGSKRTYKGRVRKMSLANNYLGTTLHSCLRLCGYAGYATYPQSLSVVWVRCMYSPSDYTSS